MTKVKQNNFFIIAVIAFVNALGYGIIIPILYSYSHRFGLNDFQNGLLFAVFSLCQFIATPIIGRLSDKFGRRPLLLISVSGTVVSFLMMAMAPSAIYLFLARALDGATAGNIPVALAVISDTSKPEDRARGFGLIGASFGFGFVFGPGISALTYGWGNAIPFLIAAAVSFLAVLITFFFLPETNKHMGLPHKEKLFDFVHMARALSDKNVGKTLLITLLFAFGYSLFIYAYQPLSVGVLHLTASQISMNFTIFGVVGLISQAVIIPYMTRKFGEKRMLTSSLLFSTFTLGSFYFIKTLAAFIVLSIIHALVNGFVGPVVQTLLSKEVDAHSQGSIMGLNASYMSIGMIVGPVVGGLVATVSIPLPFLVGASIIAMCFFVSLQILRGHPRAVSV